jgi:hypothetical protein
MIPAKVLLVVVPIALGGGYLVLDTTRHIGRVSDELVHQEAKVRAEGASFVATLHGEHAAREMLALDRRRELALELTRLRRNRFLGLFALAVAALGVAAAMVFRRISREIEEDRRLVHGDPPSRPAN